ncbi:DUF2029 domain-containing protein [Rhodococcus sp. BE178]|uniref:DUF2029 domain-containing protein n=1 Tax=Rhodococcus sp. BE178 TaxID=2817737 RepID=UPI003D1F538E
MSVFVNAMRVVGDLDDEFYSDERQRDVWNEAAAVGFQLFLWAALLAAAVLPWVAGAVGAWVALGLLVVSIAISACTMEFARRRQVDLRETATMARPRMAVAVAVYVIGAAGIVARLLVSNSDSASSTWAGVIVGAAIGGAAAVVGVRNKRRRRARFEAADD